MIAKVRIAPIQKWCRANLRDLKDQPRGALLVGLEVEILADKMLPNGNGCRGNVWPLTDKSIAEINNIVPATDSADFYLCEHMLEMD